jgi:hypothetical protein
MKRALRRQRRDRSSELLFKKLESKLMAAVPCKRLFLVAFLILCFFSIHATGRY